MKVRQVRIDRWVVDGVEVTKLDGQLRCSVPGCRPGTLCSHTCAVQGFIQWRETSAMLAALDLIDLIGRPSQDPPVPTHRVPLGAERR